MHPAVARSSSILTTQSEKIGYHRSNAKKSSSSLSSDSVDSDEREPDLMLLFLLGLTAALEGADTQLLGASTLALQEDLCITFKELALLNVAQAVCANIGAPFWGALADRKLMSRRNILIAGSLGQGAVTVSLAFVNTMAPMIVLRSLNGILLASLRPISNGIVADVTSESRHGKVFGRVQAALGAGMFVCIMTVTPIARNEYLGFQGWRIAYVVVGLLSVVVTALLWRFFEEPGKMQQGEGAPDASDGTLIGKVLFIFSVVIQEVRKLLRFFALPTFCMMIVQGIFGSIPWSVLGNMTAYFQLSGMSDHHSAMLASEMALMGIPGNIIGGMVADKLAQLFGHHGRPLNAQLSVGFSIIPLYFIFYGMPVGTGFLVYFLLIAFFGLFGSWSQSGTNFPILSDIVPAESRSGVLAWETAFENTIANAVGPPVVALLATMFGYSFDKAGPDTGCPVLDSKTNVDLESAAALGKAMAAVTCFPMIMCFMAYSVMHWTYPRDARSKVKDATAASPYGSV